MELKTIDPKECTRWSLADRSGFEFGDLHNLGEDIKKNAESVGFDLVITAPLTEKKVKEFILPLIRKKREKKK